MKNGVKNVQAMAYNGAGTVNCQVPNDVFVNLTIQESKFCKVAQLLNASVSLVRGCFERKKIFSTFSGPLPPIQYSLFPSYIWYFKQSGFFL